MQWKERNPSAKNNIVINLSLGAYVGTTSYNTLDTAVAKAVQHGITCVVAAGNDGYITSLFSPAHVTQAITVGAFSQADTMPNWCNYGPAVDILAPGVNVLTTGRRSKTAIASGTSFSAPYVAGGAALYLAAHPNDTPATVCATLLALAATEESGSIAVTTEDTVRLSVFVKNV